MERRFRSWSRHSFQGYRCEPWIAIFACHLKLRLQSLKGCSQGGLYFVCVVRFPLNNSKVFNKNISKQILWLREYLGEETKHVFQFYKHISPYLIQQPCSKSSFSSDVYWVTLRPNLKNLSRGSNMGCST